MFESLEVAAEVARRIFKSSSMDVSETSPLFADLVEMSRVSIEREALIAERQPDSHVRYSSAPFSTRLNPPPRSSELGASTFQPWPKGYADPQTDSTRY